MTIKKYYWTDEKGNHAITMTGNKEHQTVIEKHIADYTAKDKDEKDITVLYHGNTHKRLTVKLNIGSQSLTEFT